MKRLDRTRLVVLLGALMALMLGAAPRARAGQWQIKHLWRYNGGVSSPQWSGSFSSDTYYPDGLSDEYSFEGKGAHAPAPSVDNGTESPRVYSPASTHATMNCRAVLTWQPNGSLQSDPVPDKVYICEYASAAALAEEIAEQRADGSWPSVEGGGVPGFGYTLNNGFGDETKYRPNPYGDFRDCGGPNYEWRQMTAEGGHVRAVATNGDAQIEIARSLSVSVSIGNQTKAAVGGVIGYRVELVNFLLSASVQKGAPLGIKPDFQEWNGYLKQDYRLNAPGEPLVPFWSAAGTYSVVATREQGGPIFDPQRYQWSVQGAGTPYIPEPHDAVEGERFLPDDEAGTSWQKEFHLSFSAAQAGVPQTTTVRVAVTGEDAGSEALTAKVVVHWNLPRWFVTKPGAGGGAVTTVTGDADPDKPEGPVLPGDNPDDPDALEMQTITDYIKARRDFIKTGAKHIKTALEIEKAIADFYATGPLYHLGGVALGAMLNKAHDLIEVVAELRAFASKARQEAIELRQAAQQGKALGKSANEVADAEATAKEAEQTANEAETAATEAEQKASKAEDDVAEAKLHNCFVAGTPIRMADGSLKPIEQVKTGDLVESKDPSTGRQGAKRVLRLFRNTAALVLSLTLSNGERVTTTPGHPFATSERGSFTLAGKLGIGQELELSHNGHASLTRETEQAGSFPTFNFEVEGWHTYFVGKTGVWVHNESVDYSRPSRFRDEVKDKVWDAAKDKNGTVHDPLTGNVIHDGDAWDMGHRPGYEWDKLEDYARDHHWSREKLLDTYNDPKYYQPEIPISNQGHGGEAGDDVNRWIEEFGP